MRQGAYELKWMHAVAKAYVSKPFIHSRPRLASRFAGDDVIVSGVLIHRWGSMQVGQKCALEPVLKANHVEVPRNKGLQATATQRE